MFKKIITLTLLITSLPCLAQDAVEEVIVTGAMDGESYYEMPAITLKKPADYLVQHVDIINDSRSKELRNDEIRQTLQNLVDGAKKHEGIQISFGNTFLQDLDAKDKSLVFNENKSHADTSHFNISIKLKINDKKTVKQQVDELATFIKNAKKVGRTEIDIDNDIDLSIVNPEKFRYEILAKIAKENQQLKNAVGSDCAITLDGLSNRVKWERSSIGELTLYIPYKTAATCK